MISTSQDWKKELGNYQVPNRPLLVPESFIKLVYRQGDEASQLLAVASSTDEADWSDTSHITDLSKVVDRVASVDAGAWILDGTYDLVDSTSEVGYVSNSVSQMDKTFTNHPVITISFASVQTSKIAGLRIRWSETHDEYATSFSIKAYNGSSVIGVSAFDGNTAVEDNYDIEAVNFDKFEIEILSWCLPCSRARIERVIIGEEMTLTKTDIVSFEQNLSNDLLSFTLPEHSITFQIDNVNEKWNPDNPQGIYSYLTERQKISVQYAYKINGAEEWHDVGTYYMSEWSTPQNGIVATFTARSLIDLMNVQYAPTAGTYTLKALALDAFYQAGLPVNADGSIKYSVDNSLANTSITITSSFNYTCAEVVQLCANAGCAVIKILVNGDVTVVPIEDHITDYYIDQFCSYTNSEYEVSKSLKSVLINDTYTITNSSSGEIQQIDNELVQDSTQATNVGEWICSILGKRKTVTGEYRSDPRLEPYDVIKNVNQFATNFVWVTGIRYTYQGCFHGMYEGRVLRSISNDSQYGLYYAGQTYSGGTW